MGCAAVDARLALFFAERRVKRSEARVILHGAVERLEAVVKRLERVDLGVGEAPPHLFCKHAFVGPDIENRFKILRLGYIVPKRMISDDIKPELSQKTLNAH